MPYRSLADFVEELGLAGELARIEAEVDPVLEIAEVTRRIAASGGPALLFGAVKGRQFPVLTNLLGTEHRLCRALGVVAPADVAARLSDLLDPSRPEGWFDRLKASPQSAALGGMAPKPTRGGPCQQIVRLASDIDLNDLPGLQSAAQECRPIITAAALVAVDPESQCRVGGRYTLEILDRDRLAIDWAAHDEHARLLGEYRRRNQRMPVAAVLGGDPAGLLAASALLPPGVDTVALAGLLRQRPMEAVSCRSVDLTVPAEADFVLEGYVDPAEALAQAGPWCTPVGHCSPARPCPVMHVTAMPHRANPIFPAMVFGPPPHEACTIDRAIQRMFLPLARLAIPELVDYDLPAAAAARHWAALSIRKTHPGQARRVACLACGAPALRFAKVLVVVDEDVDVRDHGQVLKAIGENFNPGRDVLLDQGPPDPLDPATPLGELGHRMALDATVKLPGERVEPWPAVGDVSPEVQRSVRDRWPEYGLGPLP